MNEIERGIIMQNLESKNTVKSKNQVNKHVFFEGTKNGSPRIMFVGNSITLHKPVPEIGWYGNWGMAASAKEKDYVHLLIQHIKKKCPNAYFCIIQAAEWEREYKTFDPSKTFLSAKEFNPDVIITRFSENISVEDIDNDLIIESMHNLHKYLSGENKNTKLIVTSNLFNNKLKDTILEVYSKQFGADYVDVDDYCENEENKALEYKHEGVRMHPSDKGMKFIADRIIPILDRLI